MVWIVAGTNLLIAIGKQHGPYTIAATTVLQVISDVVKAKFLRPRIRSRQGPEDQDQDSRGQGQGQACVYEAKAVDMRNSKVSEVEYYNYNAMVKTKVAKC